MTELGFEVLHAKQVSHSWRLRRQATQLVRKRVLGRGAHIQERLLRFMSYSKRLISLLLFAAVTCESHTAALPEIRQSGAVKQLFVDNKPCHVVRRTA